MVEVPKTKVQLHKIIEIVLLCIIMFFGGYVIYLDSKLKKQVAEITKLHKSDNKYQQFYYEREFKALKEKDKALYDSLKNQEKQIKTLEQFTYRKSYHTDTIFIAKDPNVEIPEPIKNLPDSTYNYSSETDSVSYDLQVNSKVEPNWYKLDMTVKDKFTIINKDYGDGTQSISIESEYNGTIENVTAWQKSTRTKWYQRFAFGPSVTVGYDVYNKNVGVMVGASLTYNILGK